MPLYDTEYTHALIMAMVCSLAAFLLCCQWGDRHNVLAIKLDSQASERFV